MRGLHGTLAVERGATSHAVAQALGHESETTSRESYIAREAITGADQRRVLTVLAGGRTAAPRTNRTVTPRRVNDSPNIIAAESRVRKTAIRMTRRPRPPPQARRPERRLASIILVAIVPTVASIVAVDLTENRSD